MKRDKTHEKEESWFTEMSLRVTYRVKTSTKEETDDGEKEEV